MEVVLIEESGLGINLPGKCGLICEELNFRYIADRLKCDRAVL